jgi:hypothetical protein
MEYLKSAVQDLLNWIEDLSTSGELEEWARRTGEKIVNVFMDIEGVIWDIKEGYWDWKQPLEAAHEIIKSILSAIVSIRENWSQVQRAVNTMNWIAQGAPGAGGMIKQAIGQAHGYSGFAVPAPITTTNPATGKQVVINVHPLTESDFNDQGEMARRVADEFERLSVRGVLD